MIEQKVPHETAAKEVEEYLDFKKVSNKKREEQKDSIETIVDSIVSGTLSIDENKNIVQELSFPIGNGTIPTLSYKPRLTAQAINTRMKGVKGTDVDARIMGYAAALTDKSPALLGDLDTEDLRICQAIVSFFI